MASTFILNRQALNQLQSASPLQARLEFSTFRLGSAVGYEPTDLETGPRGTVVHTGVIATKDLPDGSVDLLIALSPDVGPFDFGEIHLYLSSGLLGATYAFPVMQSKLQASSNGVNSSFVVHCLLKVSQGVASITFAAPALSTVPKLTSITGGPNTLGTDVVDADGLRLVRDTGNKWSIDNHVRIRTAVAVSSVNFAGGQTSFKVTGVDNVVTSIQYRYAVQTELGQVSRVKTHDSNGTLFIDGPVPWMTNGLTLDLWERIPAQLEAHLLNVDPHPQYLNTAEGDQRYTPLSHVSAPDPHTQYLTKTAAATTLAPKTHTTDLDPHTQYQMKAAAATSFLSKTVNTLVTDSGGHPRFRFHQGVSNTRSTTELIGAADTSGEVLRFVAQDLAGNTLGTVLSGRSNGTVSLPLSNLPATDYSQNLAYTAWVIDRMRRPFVVNMSHNGPLTKLENFNQVHKYVVIGNVPFLVLNTVMVEDAIYEVHFNCIGSLPNSDIILIPNNTSYPGAIITKGWTLTESGALVPYTNAITPSLTDRFWFDTVSGVVGTNPSGVITIYNFRANKMTRYEGQDSVGLTTCSGKWNDTTTIWNTVGQLANQIDWDRLPQANSNTYSWTVTIKRIA